MSATDLTGTFYVIVRQHRGSIRPVRTTFRPPSDVYGDEVAIRLTVRMPATAFQPLAPAVTVTVPAELIRQPPPVEIEAVDANDPGGAS